MSLYSKRHGSNLYLLLLSLFLVFFLSSCRTTPFHRAPPPPPIQSGVLHSGDLDRTYSYYVPRSWDPARIKSLVVLLHGGLGSGKKMIDLTQEGFNKLAEEGNFIALYPDGYEKHWNDGRNAKDFDAMIEGIDDVKFLSALIDQFVTQYSINPMRIYVAGVSNGSMMAGRLACELSTKIAAIAMVSAPMPANLMQTCSPKQPVSVMLIGGTKDPLIPFEGGTAHFRKRKLGEVVSYGETVRFWANADRCVLLPVKSTFPDVDINDGARAHMEKYSGGQGGSEVVMVTVVEGGHTWPGGDAYAPSGYIGHTCRDFDANLLIWDFFKRHVLASSGPGE